MNIGICIQIQIWYFQQYKVHLDLKVNFLYTLSSNSISVNLQPIDWRTVTLLKKWQGNLAKNFQKGLSCKINVGKPFKEVWYSCSAHRSAHLLIIARSSHSHKYQKQPQRIFLQYNCSVTIINIVKKHLWRKIHELNT